ncbi:MAG: Carbohydrate family 9 binding domain-like [Clostridia bacterium]|jgi:hypothetical protein|nr:Carbohydrate family 9 binding domain-like [Clostridia bacterium]
MKKVIFLVVALSFIMLMQVCFFATELTVPKVATSPVIDGKIGENEWYGAAKFHSDNKQATENYFTTARDIIGASADIYYLYDESGLYILLDAIDGTKGYGLEVGTAMVTDGVQVVLDPKNLKIPGITDLYIFDFVPYTGADKNGEPCWFEHYQYNAYDANLSIKMKAKVESIGYKIEIFLPWSALKFKNEEFEVKSGTKIGIGNCLMDFDDSTLVFINYDYPSSDGGISGENLNTIILGDPVILPVPEVTASVEIEAEIPDVNPETSDLNLIFYIFMSASSLCGITLIKGKNK